MGGDSDCDGALFDSAQWTGTASGAGSGSGSRSYRSDGDVIRRGFRLTVGPHQVFPRTQFDFPCRPIHRRDATSRASPPTVIAAVAISGVGSPIFTSTAVSDNSIVSFASYN